MKQIIKEEVPKHIEEKEIYICDICGKATRYRSIDRMQKLEVEDEEESWNYPEGGYTKKYVYDFCEECTRDKVMPLIQKEFGKKPRIDEIGW